MTHTFLLSSERNDVVSVLVLQGLFLQVLEETVSVELPCRLLRRLVLLPQAGWEKSVLGRRTEERDGRARRTCPLVETCTTMTFITRYLDSKV